MGRLKDHFIELQNQAAEEWIQDRLSDKDLDEDSDEWKGLLQEFYDYQIYLLEEEEHEEELRWLKENGSSKIHKFFIDELNALERIIDESLKKEKKLSFVFNSQLIAKMAFAHSVALLEAFLGDTLKSLLNENEKLLENAISNIDELKKARYSLKDLAKTSSDTKTLAIRKVSDILFHNIPKVKIIYEQVLGKKLNVDISKVSKITDLRHHIVHRNGKTIDGECINISSSDLSNAISSIKEFASELQKEINKENNA
ncbi:MAG: hypothetical protein A3H44_10500 [Gammaproteobacteria bacterium RIFCSPLOWO2_02_FULL_57_10]|nr:MAG: hypothetical protein A3H44_10500 [Gammaproteobacteria bacterium RIFCSPLOWO2_02_FULL_57_10]